MELTKYNKLEKLGFIFWTKKKDTEIGFQSYLIGESVVALFSSESSDISLNESERFIKSVACFLNEDAVEISIEELTKEDIAMIFRFECPKIEILEEYDIKILSYPSIKDICSTSSSKEEFFMKFKEDLIS
tara:strand:+ start:790 stop:1182 length:393 start_codon:yes stop_codon:yes gene_type:complete